MKDYLLSELGLGQMAAEMGFYEALIILFAIGWVLPVGVLLVLWMGYRRRRRCRGVTIPGERGELYVTITALREFVARILGEFGEASLRSIDLSGRPSMLTLTLEVDVVPGTQLVALRDRIKDRVLEEARNKMNIDETLHRVDVKVHNWSASEAKIARQTRKLGVEKPLPKLPDLPDPEADSELSPP